MQQKQAKYQHVAFFGGPNLPLQKTSELQTSCVQGKYPRIRLGIIRGKASERFLNKIGKLKMYQF